MVTMPGGRRTTPLFDLLRRQAAATPPRIVHDRPEVRPEVRPAPESRPVPEIRPTKPVVRVELKPREIQAPAPPPERDAPPPGWNGGGFLHMPANMAYIAVAIMGTLLVVAWIAGSKLGESRQAKRDEPLIQRKGPTITEASEAPDVAAAPQAGLRASTVLTPIQPAPVAADPREKGLNYLYLAVLTLSEAERAGKYLRENGVEAYAIPMVDPKASGANNADPTYRLFVLPGVTGTELKQTKALNLQAKVVQLGSTWQKENHGTSNFAKFSWEKFQ
jgi:hypothetical protein